jgi:hypothetical protein
VRKRTAVACSLLVLAPLVTVFLTRRTEAALAGSDPRLATVRVGSDTALPSPDDPVVTYMASHDHLPLAVAQAAARAQSMSSTISSTLSSEFGSR